ncbi:MAG TPA: hypothetical protein VEC14_01055 [Reyranellaceae bacterium]|nr:hypothetical protein [Reyranellaceae bacterium]
MGLRVRPMPFTATTAVKPLLSENPARGLLVVQNRGSGTAYLEPDGNAETATSFEIAAGGTLILDNPQTVPTNAFSVRATASTQLIVWEG